MGDKRYIKKSYGLHSAYHQFQEGIYMLNKFM